MSNLIVHLKNVKIFQAKNLILEKVNLKISKGEFTYLIGKTGSGKSSLLKTLYAALPLTEGEGKVGAFDLKTLNRKTIPLLRRQLGIVFQDFNLLSDRNVEENLRFVLKATGWEDAADIQKRITEVLGQVDLRTKASKFPHELSGGEQSPRYHSRR